VYSFQPQEWNPSRTTFAPPSENYQHPIKRVYNLSIPKTPAAR